MRRNICSGVLIVCNVVFPVSQGLAQHCNPNWTAEYKCMQHCGPCPTTNNSNSNYDNGAAAAAAAQRQRDAELEQLRLQAETQRIEADNQRRIDEIEKQAKFDHDKLEALGQLKGMANGDGFDSGSGLKGVGSADSGLKDTSNSVDSSGLKTSPDVNTDPMVVDARNVPTGLPKSVEAEIPDTPAGNRVRKGFQAIQDHDWKLALAWFQDALNHDPGNAGIQRLIDLAQFTMEREKNPHPSAAPAISAPATPAQVKVAPVNPDRLMDTQMNADLAKSIDTYNRDYYLKHPGLLKPTKPSSSSQITKPATVAPASVSPATDEKTKWKLFFNNLFTPPPIKHTPPSLLSVRG